MNALKILAILTYVVTATSYAQVNDNFSDNDFNANPTWSGDVSKFSVNSGKLKLSAPAVSEAAFLSTPSSAIHNASWEFYVQMDFTPSSTNYAKVYLTADKAMLTGPLDGYFVKIGNTARDVSLYRQNGSTEIRIIDGTDDRVNGATVKIKIRVTRDATGRWQLYSDVGPSGNYIPEGTFTDVINTISAYFGATCVYTSTRSDKFWFDDFNVTGTPVPDMTPPVTRSVAAIDGQHIKVLFSESLEINSAQNIENYSIINTVTSATLQDDGVTVLLGLRDPLTNGAATQLSIRGVKDPVGNEMVPFVTSVLFFMPSTTKNKDVIFTEIFPDPAPQIGLPNAEFVEIYNRSQNPVNLANWRLSDGSSVGIFQSRIILPGEYWVVTSSSSASLFSGATKIIALQNFPSLNNSSDTLTLKNAEGFTVDSLNYDLTWYHDDDKQDGGWTLERIDPENICAEGSNWSASENKTGGTPGLQNSIFANKPDLTPPQVVSFFPENSGHVLVEFDEKLNRTLPDRDSFGFEPPLDIAKISFADKTMRALRIDVQSPIAAGMDYLLSVKNVPDCAGNQSEPTTIRFGLPEKSDSLDVVVNEILFNPRSGGVDFVEILNRSSKYLNLKGWKLGNKLSDATVFFSGNFLMSPHSLFVFSADPVITALQYPFNNEAVIFKTEMPSLPDDKGSILIVNNERQIMDAVSYSQDWHSEFIKDNEGVTLERIDPDGISDDADNWMSASSRVGFGTPGVQNSQFRNPATKDGEVNIVPEIFSPGSSAGFVQIAYNDQFRGWIANVKIFDQQGHLIKSIAQNELLGSAGFFRWDGQMDDNRPARTGYYVVWFEVFNDSGAVNTIRKRVIIMPGYP